MLGVVACVLVVVFKRMQQLPTMLGQQCKELLGACWQWCANGCNHSQQRWANNVGSCCVRLHLISFSLSQAWPLFVFLQRYAQNMNHPETDIQAVYSVCLLKRGRQIEPLFLLKTRLSLAKHKQIKTKIQKRSSACIPLFNTAL